jgi:hypothetical protein
MSTFCFCHIIYHNTYTSADLFSLLVHMTEFKYMGIVVTKMMTYVEK